MNPALEANDRDCRVAQAGEVGRRVAHMRTAAVLVACSVSNAVKAVLNVPVLADDAERHAGLGPVPAERGQAVGGFFVYFTGFDAFDRSADPGGLLSPLEVAVAVQFGFRQVDRVAAAPFDAAVPLVVRLACPVVVLQVIQNGFLVALDGGDEVVRGAAILDQASHGFLPCVHGIEGHGASLQSNFLRQVSNGWNFVRLFRDLRLPEHEAAAVIDRRNHHASLDLDLLRRAAHVFAVEGGRSASVAGAVGRQRDGEIAAPFEASAVRLAEILDGLKKGAKAPQVVGRRRLGGPFDPPLQRRILAAQHGGRALAQFAHEYILWLPRVGVLRGPAGPARVAARRTRRMPIRSAVASA